MNGQTLTRRRFVALAAAGCSHPAEAAGSRLQLLMFERRGCPWCARWNAEIGPIYPKTEAGQRAPLTRIDLDSDRWEGLQLIEPVRFTPTFVLLRDKIEVARIVGYHNDDAFWGLLDALLRRQPAE